MEIVFPVVDVKLKKQGVVLANIVKLLGKEGQVGRNIIFTLLGGIGKTWPTLILD